MRVSDFTAFMLAGEDRTGRMIEYDRTDRIFNNPQRQETADYVAGRFG